MPSLRIEIQELPYCQRLRLRPLEQIDLVVIHCTELPDLDTARRYGEKVHYPESRTGNSGHFYIDRDGSVHQWVSLNRVAHHVRGHNSGSVGIELVNIGRYPDWFDSRRQEMGQPYTEPQIERLVALLDWLKNELPSLSKIAAHETLDRDRVPASDNPEKHVFRKRDPGPLFPWEHVLARCGLVFFDPRTS